MRIQLSFQFETILARQRDTFARKTDDEVEVWSGSIAPL